MKYCTSCDTILSFFFRFLKFLLWWLGWPRNAAFCDFGAASAQHRYEMGKFLNLGSSLGGGRSWFMSELAEKYLKSWWASNVGRAVANNG